MLNIQGFGWAIAKALAEAGAEISLGVWVNTCFLLCSANTFALRHHSLDIFSTQVNIPSCPAGPGHEHL